MIPTYFIYGSSYCKKIDKDTHLSVSKDEISVYLNIDDIEKYYSEITREQFKGRFQETMNYLVSHLVDIDELKEKLNVANKVKQIEMVGDNE